VAVILRAKEAGFGLGDIRAMFTTRDIGAMPIPGPCPTLRDGSAERTGCAEGSMDAAISVNNVMLWERGSGRGARPARP
jgi:hypothetical protein